jgi:hypothetical protein
MLSGCLSFYQLAPSSKEPHCIVPNLLNYIFGASSLFTDAALGVLGMFHGRDSASAHRASSVRLAIVEKASQKKLQ